MTLGLLSLPVVAVIVWILLPDLRDWRRDRRQDDELFLPPSREVMVQTVADAFSENDDTVTWEHAYALAVLAVDVLELVEAEQ